MKLEITKEHFDTIWNEIIELEEQIPLLYEEKDTWGVIATKDRIDMLKKIADTGEIDI